MTWMWEPNLVWRGREMGVCTCHYAMGRMVLELPAVAMVSQFSRQLPQPAAPLIAQSSGMDLGVDPSSI